MFRFVSTFVLGLVLAMTAVADNSRSTGYHDSESRVRAAILFGVLRFTYWPEDSAPKEHINLCISGQSNIANSLAAMPSIPQIGSYQVKLIDHKPDSNQACHAHIVGDASDHTESSEYGALLICDDCDAQTAQNTAINLNRVGDVVRFDINLDKLEEHGVELSASVIKLANKCSTSNPEIRGCNDH